MRAKAKPFTAAQLRAPIHMPADVDSQWNAAGEIHWETEHPHSQPLDIDFQFSLEHTHRFEYVLTRDHMEPGVYGIDRTRAGLERWQRLKAVPRLGRRILPESGERALVVGWLEVVEVSSHVRETMCTSWFEAFDQFGSNVGEIAETIYNDQEGTYGCSLFGGSFFWFRQMHVHPLFRGRDIGAKLLSHALWLLVKDESVAGLEIGPLKSAYDDVEPERSDELVDGLARYYARCGFKPWQPHQGKFDTMYVTGEALLPFERKRGWQHPEYIKSSAVREPTTSQTTQLPRRRPIAKSGAA